MAFGLLTGTSGIDPDFLSRLEQLRRAMPNNLGAQIGIKSGYRSPERQRFLFNRAVQRYGSPQAARKWVAPPGHSQHNRGYAVDLSYGSPAAMRAAHEMAGQFGLVFPMSYENWHIEPAGARGGKATAGTSVSMPADTSMPSNAGSSSVAGLLAGAAGGDNASSQGLGLSGGGGGGSAGGIVGDPSPIPIPDLTTNVSALQQPTGAAPVAGVATTDPEALASLFTLPTIGVDGVPGTDAIPALPGQAKQLTRKVWL